MEKILRFDYKSGKKEIFPTNPLVKSWQFEDGQEQEATLAQSMAEVAQKNGLSANELQHLFPAVLRMLKSNIEWAI